jgi:hypothetical protein
MAPAVFATKVAIKTGTDDAMVDAIASGNLVENRLKNADNKIETKLLTPKEGSGILFGS